MNMIKTMPSHDQIQEDEELDPEIVSAIIGAVDKAAHELKDALHGGCEVVVAIENFTSHSLELIKQSEHHNNGHFKESPEPLIGKTSIGLCSSEGGTGVGNKNYVLYSLNGADLLVYWHSARVGGKTYWMEVDEDCKFGDMSDNKILNHGKDNQQKGVIDGKCGHLLVKSSYGHDTIKISIYTEAQRA
jgi:hypothetical protein